MLMSDNPYAIVCDGNGDVTERKLSDQAPGVQLAPSVAVVSNTVTDGVRTVVVTRPLQGATAAYYTFDRTQLSLNFISAIGMAASFGPHGDAPHGSDTLTMWPVGSPVCVCVTPAAKFGSGTSCCLHITFALLKLCLSATFPPPPFLLLLILPVWRLLVRVIGCV